MKKWLICLIVLFGLTGNSWATLYTGSISGPSGGLYGTGPWSSATLSWKVGYDETKGWWEYDYVFTGPEKNISHIIIEVSPGLLLYNGTTLGYELGLWTGDDQGNSNPGIPGSIYGLKWDFSNITTASITIITNRAPMWGDFYAKDGKDNGSWVYAYNSAFGSTSDASIYGPSPLGLILVPDPPPTPQVPEPGTLLLLGVGLIGLGGIARRSRKGRAGRWFV